MANAYSALLYLKATYTGTSYHMHEHFFSNTLLIFMAVHMLMPDNIRRKLYCVDIRLTYLFQLEHCYEALLLPGNGIYKVEVKLKYIEETSVS